MALSGRLWVLLTLLGMVARITAHAEAWSISQLRAELESQHTAHRSDKAVAEKLSTVELSEQLTPRTQDQLSREFHPGQKTTAVLDFLAAQSALLDPPHDESVPQPAPDDAARSAMLRAAAQFATVTLRHMPDFIATRSTRAFDDAPPPPNPVTGYTPAFTHLHADGVFQENVTYREGREIGLDGSARLSMDTARHGPPGFSSRGEFGPMLRLVLSEAFRSRLQWLRWQALSGTTAAVFHYEVPQAESKFRLNFLRGRNGLGASSANGNPLFFGGTPAYEGQLYVDPQSGAVLRITVRTILDKTNSIRRAGLAIDYRPVAIAGKTYICPVRSVADATVRLSTGDIDGRAVRHINLVDFIQYRRFGSESRIVE